MKIHRGSFSGTVYLLHIFVLGMILFSTILQKAKFGYDLGSGKRKLNHLLFMDDLKLFTKGGKVLDNLVQSVRIFSNCIKMDFRLSKCAKGAGQENKKTPVWEPTIHIHGLIIYI